MRESASDSGYGHESISCMTYDIHVDILLGCLFVYANIACALRWGLALVGVISLVCFAHPVVGPPFRYLRRQRSFEVVSTKKVGLWPWEAFCKIY